MPGLRGRDKVIPVVLMVSIGVAALVTKAEAVTIQRSADIAKAISATPTYRGVTKGSGLTGDAGRPGASLNIGQGPLISTRLLDAAGAAPVPYTAGSHNGLLIPDDPFGLWTAESDDTAKGNLATVAEDAGAGQDLPMVVSVGAAMVTGVLGWRLIAPPRPQSRTKSPGRKRSSSARQRRHETTTTRDVLRYIAETVTPRFLTRRKRSRRKASSHHSMTGNGSETIGDVARAIVKTVTPQRRHRKRRRGSRQSARQ